MRSISLESVFFFFAAWPNGVNNRDDGDKVGRPHFVREFCHGCLKFVFYNPFAVFCESSLILPTF